DLSLDARVVLRGRSGTRGEDPPGLGRPTPPADPRRPRRRRLPAPDLHEDGPGPADALLRSDRAPRSPRLRRRKLQGPVRSDRTRTGLAGEPLTPGLRPDPSNEANLELSRAPMAGHRALAV